MLFGRTVALHLTLETCVEYYEHNVGNLALEVVGQNWSSEVISVFGRLGGRAGGIKLPLDNGPFMSRNEK